MPPRRWTTEELNTADKMLSDGASFVDIGKSIDRSAAAVEAKLKGKSTPKPKPAPKKQEKAESAKPKAPTVEERPAIAEPQETASNDDESDNSTVKYIVGTVIIAVIIYLVLGD